MIYYILNIIAPVFLVVGIGYLAVSRGLFADGMIDALMRFAIMIAVPCLLFRAIATMKIGDAFDYRLMLAFYGGSTGSFILASLVAHHGFKRPPGEAVAVGFAALFSNLVLIGLPVSERAWGAENIAPVFAIVSIHAAYCYLVGITTMELLRSDGRSLAATAQVVLRAMFRNSLMIGIGLGFLANFTGLVLPEVIDSAVGTLGRAALPVALFALGGVLTRYKMADAIGEVSTITFISLLVHPLLTLGLCKLLGVEAELTRMVVLIAAMAPGLNSYLFATLYQRGQRTAASTVLLATPLSILTSSAWLWFLI